MPQSYDWPLAKAHRWTWHLLIELLYTGVSPPGVDLRTLLWHCQSPHVSSLPSSDFIF